MAKRFTKSAVDWAAFAERVPSNEKAKFLQFKAKTDRYVKNLMSYPESPPKIDFASYRSRINPALVDEFEKKYAAVKVPYPPDTLASEIDAQHQRMSEKRKNEIELSELRIQLAKKEYDWWKSIIPFTEMTLDEFKDYFPDQAYDPFNRPNFMFAEGPPKKDFPYLEKKEHH